MGGGSAEQWIAWARRKALEASGEVPPPAITAAPGPDAAAEPAPEPVLEGVVLSDAERRKAARDEAFRASSDGVMMRIMNGG